MKATKLEIQLHNRLKALTGVGYTKSGPGPFYHTLWGDVVHVVIDQWCNVCEEVHWHKIVVHPATLRPLSELFKPRRRRKKKKAQ